MPIISIPFEVERAIQLYVEKLKEVTDAKLYGFYLYGSLSLNAYEAGISDIDYLAITKEEVDEGDIARIKQVYEEMLHQEPMTRLFEGNILPLGRLGFDNMPDCPQSYSGAFHVATPRDWNAVTVYNLYNFGVPICGPIPSQIIPEVSEKEIMKTMLGNLLFLEQRMPYYARHSVESQVFGVLTLCRILYTVDVGKIASKRQAANYALFRLPNRWRELVQKALTIWDTKQLVYKGIDSTENLMQFVSIVKSIVEDQMKK